MVEIGTPFTQTAKRVVLCGSGELGKELVIELQRYGVEVIALDKYEHAPAMQVAHRSYVVSMLDGARLREIIEKEIRCSCNADVALNIAIGSLECTISNSNVTLNRWCAHHLKRTAALNGNGSVCQAVCKLGCSRKLESGRIIKYYIGIIIAFDLRSQKLVFIAILNCESGTAKIDDRTCGSCQSALTRFNFVSGRTGKTITGQIQLAAITNGYHA